MGSWHSAGQLEGPECGERAAVFGRYNENHGLFFDAV